jgi:hypothetical protein
MEAKLKRLHSPDVYNLEDYQPDLQDEFGFLLQAMIGPAGEEGEESFDIEVCTPKWIEKRHRVDEVVIGLHYLIVREYNYQRIVKAIERFLQGCSGKDWSEVSKKVSRLGFWEFEGYEEGA